MHSDGKARSQELGSEDPTARSETWAVEVSETAGEKRNREVLEVVANDRSAEGGKVIHVKLLNVATSVRCGLGGSLPVSQVNARTAKAHELHVFQKHVAPLIATPAGKRLQPKYIPVRNDRREDGLKEVAHRLHANRLYVHEQKNPGFGEKLALAMPGGCTVVGVCHGKEVSRATAARVQVFASTEADTMGSREAMGGQASTCPSEKDSGSFELAGRRSMAARTIDYFEDASASSPHHLARRMSFSGGHGTQDTEIDYYDSISIPPSPLLTSSLSACSESLESAANSNNRAVALPSHKLVFGKQAAFESMKGSLSAQFHLQRATSEVGGIPAQHFSGPLPLASPLRGSSPSASPAPQPCTSSSLNNEEVAGNSSPQRSPSWALSKSPLRGAGVSMSPLAVGSESQSADEGGLKKTRPALGRRANSAKERGAEGVFRGLSRMALTFKAAVER